jgi:hypothetical protein
MYGLKAVPFRETSFSAAVFAAEESSGAKARILLGLYGPTEVVP